MNEEYLTYIKEKLQNNFDVKYREIQCEAGILYAVYIDNLCDSKFISEYIIEPFISKKVEPNIDFIKKEVLSANALGNVSTKEEGVLHILSGDVLLIFGFLQLVLYCEAKGYSKRAISLPITEGGLKGPREGFVEVLVDNVSMIRRKIKTPNLKFESILLGANTQTNVVISYIDGNAPKQLVEYIKTQIKSIKVEALTMSNYIEEKLKCRNTMFDTIGYTEKPDVATSKLLQGKIVILVDGSPFAVIAPYFFLENFQVPDDYYFNRGFGNFARILRWAAFATAALLPGFYIALICYHFSLIPTVFVIRLAISRAGVPFPTVVEVFLMMFFFQIVREAGIRLPQPIGQAMSIVGALILGNAVVESGLASQSTLIIVALSSISSFLNPKVYGGTFFWASLLILISAALGLPGFYLGFCIFIAHLAGLNTCGYPYLFPFGTLKKLKYRDLIIREELKEISNTIFNEDEK